MDPPSLKSIAASAVVASALLRLLRKAGQAQREEKDMSGIELMIARNKKMVSKESEANGQGFKPRKSDVFITTYAKCGTTWTMQIVHQLRSGGDMDFEEITEVIPWDVLALDCKQDLNSEQKYFPRCFKSHEQYQHIAKGGRYIYIARNPLNAMLSFFKFLPQWMWVPQGSVTIEEFVDAIFAGASNSGQIWSHFLGWYEHRKDPNVLWLFFEDLKRDLRSSVLRIAKFLDMQPTEELVTKVCHMSHHSYMKDRQVKFDDHFVFDHVKAQIGLEGYKHRATKVRKSGGKVGEGKAALSEPILKRLREKWESIIESKTKLKTYEELCEDVRKSLPEYYDTKYSSNQ